MTCLVPYSLEKWLMLWGESRSYMNITLIFDERCLCGLMHKYILYSERKHA